MPLSTRQEKIVALYRSHGELSIAQVMAHFDVAAQTIRRDINNLCDANMLRRTHGGARLLAPGANQPYDVRRVRNLEGKARIGIAAAAMIPSGSTILIGIGTTPEQAALALLHHERLTIITNNLRAALALSTRSTNRVIVPGGCLRQENPDILGAEADAVFRGYRADFGLYGVGGIDNDGALLDYDKEELASREALMSSCRQSILLADAWKFSCTPPVRGGSLLLQPLLITDAPPPEALRDQLTEHTKVVVA